MGGEGYVGTEDWCFNCGDAGHLGDVSHGALVWLGQHLFGDLRTAPRPRTSTTSQGSPQHSAGITSAPGPSLTRASRLREGRTRNRNVSGTTKTVGEMDMGLHFPSTSENRGGRRSDKGWRAWTREREKRKKTTSSPGTSRAGRYRRTNGVTTGSNRLGL